MEATRIIGGIAFTTAFFAAMTLFCWLANIASHKHHGSEAAAISGIESDRWQHMLRNGIRGLIPVGKYLVKIKVAKKFIMRLQAALEQHQIVTYPTSLASLLIAGALIILFVGTLIANSFVFSFTALLVCIILLNGWIAKQEEACRVHLREELPSALQAMNACFCIGYSLPQIFEQVSLDLEGPLKTVFQRTAAVIGAGGTIEEALEALKRQTKEPELFFLATALEIQHRTGSSLSQVLDVVRSSVEDQIELKQLLQTQTAQAKLSAQIVTIMPFLLIALFSLISEGFLEPFFTSTIGVALLALAIAMQVIGITLVRKLLQIEVL